MDRKLNIFYRHVHSKADAFSRDPNKVRPTWFSYESCFRNLVATVANDPLRSNVELTLLFDGSFEDFEQDFSSKYIYSSPIPIKVLLITAGSDESSAIATFDYVFKSDLKAGDIFYTLENDYMHMPGWVSTVFELFDSGQKFDYVSLYDHRDKYVLPMYSNLSSRLICTTNQHWRTAPSTCGSFLGEISLFRLDYEIFQLKLKDYFLFDTLVNGRGRTLVTPVPGLATHCMAGYLSPTIDWSRYIL